MNELNQLKSKKITDIIYKDLCNYYLPLTLKKRLALPPIEFNFFAYCAGHGIQAKSDESINQKVIRVSEDLYNRLLEKESLFTVGYIAIVFNNKVYAMTFDEAMTWDVTDDTFYLCLLDGEFYDEYNGMMLDAIHENLATEFHDELLDKIKKI